jgi:hypothetical protein
LSLWHNRLKKQIMKNYWIWNYNLYLIFLTDDDDDDNGYVNVRVAVVSKNKYHVMKAYRWCRIVAQRILTKRRWVVGFTLARARAHTHTTPHTHTLSLSLWPRKECQLQTRWEAGWVTDNLGSMVKRKSPVPYKNGSQAVQSTTVSDVDDWSSRLNIEKYKET